MASALMSRALRNRSIPSFSTLVSRFVSSSFPCSLDFKFFNPWTLFYLIEFPNFCVFLKFLVFSNYFQIVEFEINFFCWNLMNQVAIDVTAFDLLLNL